MAIETTIIEQRKELEDLLITGGSKMEKEVREIIKKVLKEFRNKLSADARAALPSDPRQAYRAVKHSVYKQILGGSFSILNQRRAGKRGEVPPVAHKLETSVNSKGNHRGGNRRPRSQRTEDILSYKGKDRGFILRFLNAGTDNRETRYGNRGSITARNWFPGASQAQMAGASQVLADMIDKLIKEHYK